MCLRFLLKINGNVVGVTGLLLPFLCSVRYANIIYWSCRSPVELGPNTSLLLHYELTRCNMADKISLQ